MLYQWIRVFDDTAGSLVDVSLDNQDESSVLTMDISDTKYYYIGKYVPFNNFYIKIGDTPNDVSATLKLEYWSGQNNDWKEVVDLLDGTSSGGVTLAKSGVVQFSPHIDYNWQRVYDTSDNTVSGVPAELNSLTVYNLYWLRVSASTDINVATEINRFCYSFTTSQQLDNLDTQINSFLTGFGASKTDWEDEIITSSEHVVADLKRRGIISDEGQILNLEDVSLPTDWYTLSLIYYSLGPSFEKQRAEALRMYNDTLMKSRLTLDKNNNAFTSTGEIKSRVSTQVR